MAAELTDHDIKAFEPEAKIGLLATVDRCGRPHITLITTIQARSKRELIWGQFCEGESKNNVRQNPKTAFLVMNADKEVWRGTAQWAHERKEGDEYIHMNQLPMFRYNSYFGIHTVHYMQLESFLGKGKLSMPAVVAGSLITALSRHLSPKKGAEPALKPWARSHLGKMGTLKFVAYVKEDGFPHIVPVVPTHVVDPSRLVLAPTVYASELAAIPAGATVALFALSLEMESVLVRGAFSGIEPIKGMPAGLLDIDWVYNTMPPLPGQVYPPQPLLPVRDFA